MPRAGWYIKRLRVMSAREIFHRVWQQLGLLSLLARHAIARLTSGRKDKISRSRFCSASEQQLPDLPFNISGPMSLAENLLEGEISLAGGIWRWQDSPDIWHLAPDTGRSWPRRFFSTIHYREGNPVGDVRIAWEPSRLQHLVDLALVAHNGTKEQSASARRMVSRQLASWVRTNPPFAGVHYVSAMECALRLIAVCHALDLLRGELDDDTSWRGLLAIVDSHLPLIEGRLSLYSSAGNHTMAEAAALVYAGLLFPEIKKAEHRLSLGLGVLDSVCRDQVLPDGGGAEQAITYHLFNVQLLALVQALLEHYKQRVPCDIRTAVDRGSRFLGATKLAAGIMLPIGDSDSGFALSRHLRLGLSNDVPLGETITFEDSGYTIARVSTEPRVELVFDHGPLGMAPAFGHGHADALSLLMTVDGEQVLADTGTYTYTGDQAWRRYFRGTSAHNTVTVDSRDQANQDGCFMWSEPYLTRLIASEISQLQYGRLIADHDGYREIGVRHTRGVAWLQDEWILVWDCLSGSGHHDLGLHWHLASAPTSREPGEFVVSRPGGFMSLKCLGGRISTHHGDPAEKAGWLSPGYGMLSPCTTLRLSHSGPLPHEFITRISLHRETGSMSNTEEALKWFKIANAKAQKE